MTGPFRYEDRNATLGVESPLAGSEWETMLQRRSELVSNIEARLNLANTIRRNDPRVALTPGQDLQYADHTANQHMIDGQNADGSPTQYQRLMAPPSQEETNQLLGAADYWGIKNADKIPAEALKKIVEAKRLSAEGTGNDRNLAADIAYTSAAAAGLGLTQGLIEMSQHIPFIGDAIAQNRQVQQSSRFLAGVNESVQAGMTAGERTGYKIAHGLGGALGYIIPGEAAWQIAGAAGKLGALGRAGVLGKYVASPIGRAAIQGATSAWLLEGAGLFGEKAQQSQQQAAFKVGIGAAGGAAIAAMSESLPRIFEKVKQAFRPASAEPQYTQAFHEGSGIGDNAAYPEGPDWWFDEPAKQLGSGSPPPPPVPPPGPPPTGWNDLSAAELDTRINQAPVGSDEFYALHQERISRESGMLHDDILNTLPADQREQVASTINNLIEQRDMARRMIETDPLTGLGNKEALNRARPTADSDPLLGVASFDGKAFKPVNDAHGHDAGDKVLQHFGQTLQQVSAEMNIPARLFRQGGDEFAAIVPKDQLNAFVRRVEELSAVNVGGEGFPNPQVVRTQLQGYGADTFGEADLALMNNKRGGLGSQITPSNLGPRRLAVTENTTPSGEDTLTYLHEVNGRQVATTIRPGEDESTAVVDWMGSPGHRTPGLSEGGIGASNVRAIMRDVLADHPNVNTVQFERLYAEESARAARTAEVDISKSRGDAAALSKQATLMESPAVVELGAQTEIDEADVVRAALFTNPGRVNIIQGVGDVSKIVRKLAEGQLDQRLMPHDFRVVERNGQMDLLVSDGVPITNKRVAQYKELGFFDGQTVRVNGKELDVRRTHYSPDSELVVLHDPYLDIEHVVHRGMIAPGRHTGPAAASGNVANGPSLYKQFRQYVEGYMNSEAAKMPAGATVDTGWTSTETSSQLPRLMDAFLDETVGQSPMTRAAVEGYFNVRRVADYQALAPEETEDLRGVMMDLSQARADNPREFETIEDLANSRGMTFLPDETGGGTMVDKISDLRVPVANQEAGREFLKNFNRDLPDYTPISEVPTEVMGVSPHAANPGDDMEPVLESGAEGQTDLAHDSADVLENVVAVMNGPASALTQPPAPSLGFTLPSHGVGMGAAGGGAGSPPPPPRGPATGGGATPPVPPNPPAFGQQFARLSRTNPLALQQAMSRFDSAWFNLMTPFRSEVLAIQSDLERVGINAPIWKHYNDIATNRVIAHNEGNPWQAEYAGIMSRFERIRHRTGEVMRMDLIVNRQQQLQAMQAAGFAPDEIAAMHEVDNFYDKFLSTHTGDPIASSRVRAYLMDVWQRQSQGYQAFPDPYADANRRLTPELQFFKTMLRGTNMQLSQMDARQIGQKMIRAAMFEKHIEGPYNAMKAAWNQSGVPQKMQDFVNDWLTVVKTGHNPGYDVMIQGVRHTLNTLGVPVNDSEVAALSNVAFSNMYRAQIGGRPDAIFRDSIQPFFTGVRIGIRPIASAYNRFFTGGQVTKDMIQRGVDGGWLEKGLTQVANADVFESPMYAPGGQALQSPADQAKRDMMAKLGDLIWATTPKALRNGLQGTRLDPMHYYTKLGELNRLVSGDAGWQLADNALATYQSEMTKLLATTNPSPQQLDELMATLMSDSKANVWPKPIQDEFRRLVEAGDRTGAANLMGNEAANMQFRYGQLENPTGIRKMGVPGKAIMQFGTFTQQYIAQMDEMARAPGIPVAERVKMLARYSAITAALGIAGAYTNWKFGKWMWHTSVTFAGGPVAQSAYDAFMAATGAIADATQDQTGYGSNIKQKAAMRGYENSTLGDVATDVLSTQFPYTSTVKTLTRTYDAMQGVNPVEGTARVLITGEQGIQPDLQQWMRGVQDARTTDPNASWRRRDAMWRAGAPPPVLGHSSPVATPVPAPTASNPAPYQYPEPTGPYVPPTTMPADPFRRPGETADEHMRRVLPNYHGGGKGGMQ